MRGEKKANNIEQCKSFSSSTYPHPKKQLTDFCRSYIFRHMQTFYPLTTYSSPTKTHTNGMVLHSLLFHT